MLFNTEPSVIISAVGGLITAAIPLLARTFGWTDDIADDWEALLNSGLILLSAILIGFAIRTQVTPVANPTLPIGTVVNKNPDLPTGVVVEAPTA